MIFDILDVKTIQDELQIYYEAWPGLPASYYKVWKWRDLLGQLPENAAQKDCVELAVLLLRSQLEKEEQKRNEGVDLKSVAIQKAKELSQNKKDEG